MATLLPKYWDVRTPLQGDLQFGDSVCKGGLETGGNAGKLKKFPPGTILGGNRNAFLGGFRMWSKAHLSKVFDSAQRHPGY